jgi:hypothetical protein
MLFMETIPVYCENHTRHTNALCRQNAEFQCAEAGGAYTVVTTRIKRVKHEPYVAKGEGEDNDPSPTTIRRHEFWFMDHLATGLLSLGALVLGSHFSSLHVAATVSSVIAKRKTVSSYWVRLG